jgi:GTPase SAR1 family protein
MRNFFLMGPRGAGKTTIVKRLQAWSEDKQLTPFGAIPPTEVIQQSSFKADFVLTANAVWLNDYARERKPVLVLLSKCDVPGCIRLKVIDEIIGFDRVPGEE